MKKTTAAAEYENEEKIREEKKRGSKGTLLNV